VPNLAWENKLRARGHTVVAGIDEVGRGPWAGPLVAAAVILPARFRLTGLDDSKKLTATDRERLSELLIHHPSVQFHLAVVSAEELDTIGLQ
jgi:ribonuclease HII